MDARASRRYITVHPGWSLQVAAVCAEHALGMPVHCEKLHPGENMHSDVSFNSHAVGVPVHELLLVLQLQPRPRHVP
jgi:hypothetical protein